MFSSFIEIFRICDKLTSKSSVSDVLYGGKGSGLINCIYSTIDRLKKREITVDSELRKYDRSTSTQHVAIHCIDITVQDTEVTPNQMEYVMSLPPDTTHTGQVNPGLTTDDIEPPIRKSATRYSEIDLNAGY